MECRYVCDPCEPCKTVCEADWRCKITPCPNLYVEPCTPCESGIYISPICNENLLLTGASKCDYLFCNEGRKMKYYVVDE